MASKSGSVEVEVVSSPGIITGELFFLDAELFFDSDFLTCSLTKFINSLCFDLAFAISANLRAPKGKCLLYFLGQSKYKTKA